MANLMEGGKVTVMNTLPSANIRVGFYIAIVAVNIVFSITASLGNVLILIALRKVTSIHPPTKLLFHCLAITDLGVGLISQPLMATLILLFDNIDTKIWNILSSSLGSLSIIFTGVSVFASTALSCGQTSRPVFGVEVQTRCNTEANSCSSCLWLLNRCIGCVGLEFLCKNRHEYYDNFLDTLSDYLAVFLHEDRP